VSRDEIARQQSTQPSSELGLVLNILSTRTRYENNHTVRQRSNVLQLMLGADVNSLHAETIALVMSHAMPELSYTQCLSVCLSVSSQCTFAALLVTPSVCLLVMCPVQELSGKDAN